MFDNINQFPEQKVFSTAIEIETSKNRISAHYSIKKTSDIQLVNFFEASSKESVIWTSSAVFHKSIFSQIGDFDEQLRIGEDTDLWIRIGLKNNVVFSWKILARYGYDQNSISRDVTYYLQERTYLKHYQEEKTNILLKKYLDLNRFSEAIKHKIANDEEKFKITKANIDLNLLAYRKRILLTLPSFILRQLISIKNGVANIGIGKSVFK
jgi:hypothetical protein